jgi:receptor-type tyrosine-protein phosphatase R
LPFVLDEHSRVHLLDISDDPIASYINANYVRAWPNQTHAYIATQGPLANTILDFYRMIWQENVPVIVMMTRLWERNKVRQSQ